MEEVIHADHVFVMDSGHVVMQGTPREIFSQVDRLKKLHLDVPQVTELAYELKKSGIDLPDGILTKEELVEELLRVSEEMKSKPQSKGARSEKNSGGNKASGKARKKSNEREGTKK